MTYYIFKKETWQFVLGIFLAFLFLVLILPLSIVKKSYKGDGFTVMVDYGNGVEKKFWGSSKMNRSAWDTLQQASAHLFLEVDVAEDFYPASIDQKQNGEDGKKWALYINNKRIFASPIEVRINSGDKVLWKFE